MLLTVVPIGGLAFWFFYDSTSARDCSASRGILDIPGWFDPAFLQYNLIFAVVAIELIPFVPFLYVRSMAPQKRERLKQELPKTEVKIICHRLDERLRYRYFWGSVILSTIVVSLGVTILLMFKPMPEITHVAGVAGIHQDCGIDFSKGANMLMMGPFIELFTSKTPGASAQFYHQLIIAQVGFQFGFLGAYVYFLTDLARSYFAIDLTPETLIDGTIRIAIASVLSLILSFVAESLHVVGILPLVSFFFGFFPKQVMAVIEHLASKIINSKKWGTAPAYQEMPLSALYGIGPVQELRLEREGITCAENMSNASPVDLAFRTGFGYCQLKQWKDEAWLAVHLREDYAAFVIYTGLLSKKELERFLQLKGSDGLSHLLPSEKANAAPSTLRHKLAVVAALLQPDASHP